MIELYKFGPAFGLRETGPFVLKLMAYIRGSQALMNYHDRMQALVFEAADAH